MSLLLANLIAIAAGLSGNSPTSPETAIALQLLQQDFSIAGNRTEVADPATYPIQSIPLVKQYTPVLNSKNEVWAYKTSYFGEIKVGSDQSQTFSVIFDTGSGHVVLPSQSCRSTACLTHRRYDRSLSPSAIDIEADGRPINESDSHRDQVNIAFGKGEVLGEFVKDHVCVGPSSCVLMHSVLALKLSDDPFADFKFDGVMGLGLIPLTLNDKFSFFGQMMAQNPGMQTRFAVFLAQSNDGESMITFGGHDEKLAASPIKYVPIIKPEMGHWQLQIKSVKIGGRELEECADGSCYAIADTGTSLLGVPRVALQSMHRLLARPVPPEQEQSDDVDCRTIPGQTIDFDLGDTVLSMHVEDYSRPRPINMTVPPKNGSLLSKGSPSWKWLCRSLLLPIEQDAHLGSKMFIWGEPLLRRYYTVYDFGEKKIGFGLAGKAPPKSSWSRQVESTLDTPIGSLLPGAPLPDNVITKSLERAAQSQGGSAGSLGDSNTQVVDI